MEDVDNIKYNPLHSPQPVQGGKYMQTLAFNENIISSAQYLLDSRDYLGKVWVWRPIWKVRGIWGIIK